MRYIVFLLLTIQVELHAQTTDKLVTWMNLDNPLCLIEDEFGDPGVVIFSVLDTFECVCGATGNGGYFDGAVDEYILLTGPSIKGVLGAVDFTLSFYFKPDEGNNTSATPQVLFAKRNNCDQDSSFVVKYFPGGSRQLSVELFESVGTSTTMFASLPNTCWHHITIVRKDSEVILYHNGNELKRAGTINGQRVRISTEHEFTFGNSECSSLMNTSEAGFKGILDEIRLYNRALNRDEIEDLYLFPDNIANGLRFNDLKDTTIFLGGSVPIRLTENCAGTFAWSPTTDVDNPNIGTPIISPIVSTTYMVEIEDTLGMCKQIDSIFIEVIDPASIKCGDIFLPTAFTPNEDGLNDKFGISNPFSTGEILAFEIYDRWGNIVFSTTDVLEKWDGSYRGTPVNPGVFLYKLQYRCEDVEDLLSGSVTVIR